MLSQALLAFSSVWSGGGAGSEKGPSLGPVLAIVSLPSLSPAACVRESARRVQ